MTKKYKLVKNIPAFNPAHAAFYTTTVDPPGTAAFRRSLETVKAYNDLLYGLASGQTAEALANRAAEFSLSVTRAATEAATLGQSAGIQGIAALTKFAETLNGHFSTIKPLFTLGLEYRSRQVFRESLLQSHETVQQILAELQMGTKVVFPVLTYQIEIAAGHYARGGKLTAAEIKRIEAYRQVLSEWTILLQESSISLRQAVATIKNDQNSAAPAVGLVKSSVELQKVADSARKTIAELAAN